jgi:adenylate kinase
MRLIFFGPPGAGKGTVAAELLARCSGAVYIASGDRLRALVRSDPEKWGSVRRDIASGRLVADEVILDIWQRGWTVEVAGRDFIFDGFPRTAVQLKAMETELDDCGLSIEWAVHFEVNREVILDRLGGRRLCPRCSRVYHVRLRPPSAEGACDVCGERLVIRADDAEEVVSHRLRVYDSQTLPIRELFSERGQLLRIDGSKPPDALASEILARGSGGS